jgi:hypothetical protein
MPDDFIDVGGVFQSLLAAKKQMQAQQQAEQQAAIAQYAAEANRKRLAESAALAAEYERNPSAFTQQIAETQPAPTQDQGESIYGADAYEQQRKAIQKGKEYGLAKMSKMNVSEQQYKVGKDFLDTHYGPDMKPFTESDQYKNAQLIARENVTTTQANMLSNLNKTITSIEKIEPPKGTPEEKYDEEKRREQSSQIKTFLTQLINSAKGSADAEQANEFLRRSPEIVSLPEYQALMGKGLMNAAGVISFLQSREGKTLKEQMAQALSSNPEAYLRKAKIIHNDLADTYNERMTNQVIVPTSPKIAEKNFGIKMMPKFEQAQQQAPADVTVVRPEQAQAAPAFSRDQIMAELERRKAARTQQPLQSVVPAPAMQPTSDFTGRQGF